jgi:hypothetical protein
MRKGWRSRIRGPRVVATLVSLVALATAVIHVRWPALKVDAIALALLALAALPWLGEILESLDGPGGWKVKYRELQAAVERNDAAVPLVETVTEREDKPFGEYWALKALRQVLGCCGPDPRRTVEPTLRDHLRTLRPGMDRHRELQGLLDSLYGRSADAAAPS